MERNETLPNGDWKLRMREVVYVLLFFSGFSVIIFGSIVIHFNSISVKGNQKYPADAREVTRSASYLLKPRTTKNSINIFQPVLIDWMSSDDWMKQLSINAPFPPHPFIPWILHSQKLRKKPLT